jgi:hypothetical protein
MKSIRLKWASALFGAAALVASTSSFAVAVVDKPLKDFSSACNSGGCGWSVMVDGELVGSGTIGIGSDGSVSINGGEGWQAEDGSAYISGLSGNVDPFLVFAGGALNTTAVDKTYAFSFSMPLIPALPAPIATFAEMAITLTPPSTGFAQVYATSTGGHIMEAQDIDITPAGPRIRVNKGVDLFDESMLVTATGDGVFATVDTMVYVDSATGSILTGGPYDLMVVNVAFGLTPGAGMGFSGKVEQIPVPEPSTYAMLGIGLATLAFAAKRRQRA